MMYKTPEMRSKKRTAVKCANTPYEIAKKAKHCKMCYANHSKKTKQEVDHSTWRNKKYCNQTKLGCPQCLETICQSCWPTYIANGHNKVDTRKTS